MKILYANDQTRLAVIAAFQANTSPIGWVLQRNAGMVYNPAGNPNQYTLVVNVQNTLAAINPSTAILVMGNSGISITNNGITTPILQSTFNGQLSDDFVSSSLLQGVTFETGVTVR